MITLLSNVAIQDTTAASNIVYLNNIMEGVDGAATFGYSLEATSVKVDDNQTQQYMHDHTFDIRVLQGSSADLTKIKVIDANNNPVRVAGYSPDGFFVIDDPAQLTYHSQYDSVIADRVLVTTTGVNGYGGTAPGVKLPVYAGDNLLAVYKVNSGSASALNSFDQADSGTVTGDSMSFGSGDTVLSRSIFFPFPGLSVTGLVNITTGTSYSVAIVALDSAGSVLSSISDNFTGTGVKTVTGVLPASTASVQFEIVSGTGTVVFKEPAIRLQGSTFSL